MTGHPMNGRPTNGHPTNLSPPPEDTGPLRVRTHPGLCLGWGECHRWAPEVYPLDDEGKIAVHLLEVPVEHAAAARWGAAACPEQAITIVGPVPAPRPDPAR
jgi:ferredoxin